jgi:hypothetical protein
MTVCNFKVFTQCALRFDENMPLDAFDHLYANHNVCKCHPLCNSITYSYEVKEFYKNINFTRNWQTQLTFRYKHGEHFSLLRYQPFKLVDFLSYVGGILGLFVGVSVLSIVELVY